MRIKNLQYRMTLMRILGDKCEICGDGVREHLTLDHKDGSGGAQRGTGRSNHKTIRAIVLGIEPTENYRTLCMSCNAAIGRFGYSPIEAVRRVYEREYLAAAQTI